MKSCRYTGVLPFTAETRFVIVLLLVLLGSALLASFGEPRIKTVETVTEIPSIPDAVSKKDG